MRIFVTIGNGASSLRTNSNAAGKSHFAKKPQNERQNVNYIGRYLKRPPMVASALRHYTGGGVVHHDYDHCTQQYRRQVLSQEEMLLRYISHIPSRHFKMVRYYGFLSNRKRGELLPKVYTAQGIEINKKPQKLGFASLMKNFTHVDPYECVLCGSRMVLTVRKSVREPRYCLLNAVRS